MTQSYVSNPIEYLLRRKFPDYSAPPISRRLPGSSYASALDSRQNMLEEVEAYRATLKTKSSDELQALCQQEHENELKVSRARAEFEEQQRPFNRPGAKADFRHWSKATYWTLDEAIALSFGRAPEMVTWELVKPYSNVSPFAARYSRVRDLVLRAKAWSQLYDPALPGFYLAWARRNDIEVPPELIQQIQQRGIVVADWKDMHDKLKAECDEVIKIANQRILQGNEAIAKYQEERASSTRANERLMTRVEQLEATHWEGFDEDSKTYPRELDIALQAWRGTSRAPSTESTAKEQIGNWLDAHYPSRRDLSNEARDRIAVICNWEKAGGRRRRSENSR